jgi:cytochrome c oxidase cbb3-type subunit 2
MGSEYKLLGGAMVALLVAAVAMIVIPFLQLDRVTPPAGLLPYTPEQARGRKIYMANGCNTCHSQQPSSTGAGRGDARRGWGRASVPADYFYDNPPMLGTMRTGPDLFNIGVRQPSVEWHLGHLFQPRAYAKGSTMPAFPFLFELRDVMDIQPQDHVIVLPPGVAPPNKKVVATRDSLDLAAYLTGLKHVYPVLTPVARISQ